MALELRQQLKLSQQLVMTPQLQQAIRLLQLSRLELMETIQQELIENPFLEESFDESTIQDPEIITTKEEISAYDQEIAKNADWEDYLGEFSSSTRQSSFLEFENSEDGLAYDARHTERPSLQSHLLWQLHLSKFSDQEKEIGEAIIDNLTSSGYLSASDEEIASLCNCSSEDVSKVLSSVQLFDPVGVAARSPKECLMIQIKLLKYDRDPILVSLITEHLEDLEAKRYKPILRKLKLTIEDLKEYLDIIQSLDPVPGASFGDAQIMYVSPDVYVYPLDDDFVIILNEEGLPNLQLSSLYDNCKDLGTEQEKEYFQEKIRSASWLIKSLHQRQRTLYKVVQSIVKFQKNFFLYGPSKLKPLILKDIAEDIEMHESTVSRITTNKYVCTSFGNFELKYFFNSALSMDDGSEVGSESVKLLIKKFIDEENKKDPLSDEKISEMLKDALQINIARRTIAKYRTALDIPSSSKRRSFF